MIFILGFALMFFIIFVVIIVLLALLKRENISENTTSSEFFFIIKKKNYRSDWLNFISCGKILLFSLTLKFNWSEHVDFIFGVFTINNRILSFNTIALYCYTNLLSQFHVWCKFQWVLRFFFWKFEHFSINFLIWFDLLTVGSRHHFLLIGSIDYIAGAQNSVNNFENGLNFT